MNQTNLSRLILPVLFLPLAITAIIKLLTDGGNQLGNAFLMLTVFGALIGIFSPRAGFFLFIVFQFYIDFFKRLLIVGDSLTTQDVMISLGMGPIIVVAACVTCTIYCLTGKLNFFNRRDIIYFVGCVGVSLLGLIIGQREGGSGGFAEIAQALLGSSMLGMTAFASYALIHDRIQQHKIFKYITIGAIPMAIYTFHQNFNGISAWEERYILTGLSQVLYSFYLIDGIDDMRPFSTLNTHTALGAVSATIFLIGAVLMVKSKRLFGVTKSFNWIYFVATLLFLGSCYLSKNRTTYAAPILGIFLVFAFKNGKATLLFYASCLSFFIWVVVNSEWINSSILMWSSDLEGTVLGDMIGSLGSYQARLAGFMELANLKNWAPFGLEEGIRPKTHDQITELLVKIGYVPLFTLLTSVASVIFWWHRKCLQIQNPNDRLFLTSLTGIIVSLGICSVAYGNLIFVAPVNSLLGVMIGMGMATIRRDHIEKKSEVKNTLLVSSQPRVVNA
jgi:hypothetical protein